MNVYSHIVYNSLKVERAQMLAQTKTVTDNRKEQTNDKCNSTEES